MSKLEDIQKQYYKNTAELYDSMHVQPDDEHFKALGFIQHFIPSYNISTILDVGCGTGRALQYFIDRNIKSWGVEPVHEMIIQAQKNKGVPSKSLICGKG